MLSAKSRRTRASPPPNQRDDFVRRRVAAIWNWLPTFRAVAELEHVHAAARKLHVAPSAVSRTIKLLESELGTPLFLRVGRGLRLTEKGQQLLRAARSAIRLVDDALDEVPRLRVAADGRLTMTYISAALERLRLGHPTLVADISAVPAHEVEAHLLMGWTDVAVVERVSAHPELVVTRLGAASIGVYCGPLHPLRRRRSVSLADMLRHSFAAPPEDRGRPSIDGWPVEIPRTVMLRTALFDVALAACASSSLLAVLPDDVVQAVAAARLHRLPYDVGESLKVYAVRRRSLMGGGGVAEAFVKELSDGLPLRERATRTTGRPRRS